MTDLAATKDDRLIAEIKMLVQEGKVPESLLTRIFRAALERDEALTCRACGRLDARTEAQKDADTDARIERLVGAGIVSEEIRTDPAKRARLKEQLKTHPLADPWWLYPGPEAGRLDDEKEAKRAEQRKEIFLASGLGHLV